MTHTLAFIARHAAMLSAIIVSAACLPLVHPAGSAELARSPRSSDDSVVLENDACRYVIGADGKNRAMVSLADQQDYAQPDVPFMLAGQGTRTCAAAKVELRGNELVISFAECPVQVTSRIEIHPRYFTVEITNVSDGELDWLQLCNLRVKMRGHGGSLVNASWDGKFAACVMALNDQVDCGSHGVATARAYREYGIVGAKVAIIGVPMGAAEESTPLLDAIERVELEQGLPHPTINGVWIKRAPERFASYLMVSGVTQKNIDQVIDFARGGFGCIEIFWARSTPTYEPNPKQFPDGLAGLKGVADKVHAAGFQLGMHVMQGMVGWGAKDDPYITPKADPRLLQDRRATLATPLDEKSRELLVCEETTGWPEKGDLYVDGEIIRYEKLAPRGFLECQRGLHGTTVAARAEGTQVGHLVNCFPVWGHTVYCPDVKSDMVDEICDRIANVFNEVGADMSYFDGGEEIIVQPPQWRNQGRIALGVQSRLRKPVILEGNALYTHLSWHVISRGGPSFDPIYFGRRAYTLRFKGQNPAHWSDNLLTGDVGWFTPHTHSAATDAVTPDEVELLCLKAVGGKSPISFIVDADNLNANRRMPEMREIIRTCDDLKRKDYFTEEACSALRQPMAEHTLDRAADGGWDLRPLQFGPPRVANAADPSQSEWSHTNPHDEQSPWLRIRARTALAPHGSPENHVLADAASGAVWETAAAAETLTSQIEPSPDKSPDGGPVLCYRAENRATATSSWGRATLTLPKPLDLTRHRRLGFWMRSEAPGGILNVQLAGTDARRDHYIDLSNRQWTYVVLDPPEEGRFFDYSWPYPFTDVMYTCYAVYGNVKQLNLFFNALPAGAKATCWIGRIEALEERRVPLVSPALRVNGKTLTFPVSLQPDDYLEMDWTGQTRHFDPNGAELALVRSQGEIQMASGENRVQFSCSVSGDSSPRAEVTLCVRGKPLADARNMAH